ncbi:MAG: hypothetical protein HRT61_23820 [Ekhidna sp.]|nr:hypothetical protein [Ekhidna sp.]
MKNLFVFILTSVLFSACTQNDCCTVKSTGLDIYVLNSKGEDLLHPETGTIRHESILLHHAVDGELVMSRRDRNNPSFGLYGENYALGVFALGSSSGIDTMYITWPDLAVDTVLAEIEKDKNSTIARKFWYNGELVFDGEIDELALHTLVK